jgi:hypothetical protein
VLIAAALVGVTVVSAQRERPPLGDPQHRLDLTYDGRFTFVRLRWGSGSSDFGWRRSGWSNAWNHDYPRADRNIAVILKELTFIDARTDGSRILSLDDPELCKYPIAYMWEPGFWTLTDPEAQSFREYLLKGGLAVFEDFEYDQWDNFEAQMRRVLPEGRWIKLDASNPVFDTFFRMKTIDFPHPMYNIPPTYYGLYEDNDPSRRLMVIADYNNDVPEYWEWSDTGLFAIDASNEAYKLGVNYIVYGLTH